MFVTLPAYGVVYTYDELNRLTGVEYDPDNKITYQYDSAGNILKTESTGDKLPPVVTVELNGTEGDNGWYKSDVTATVYAADEESGVKVIEYTRNEEPLAKYTEPLAFNKEGKNILRITATDNYGNKSEELLKEVNIDKTKPEITIPLQEAPKFGDEYTLAPIVADATSGVASITVTVNDQPANVGDKLTLQLGDTVIKVVSKDNAGNVAEQTATITIVDEVAPVSEIAFTGTAGQDGWYTSDVTAAITAIDEGGSQVKGTIISLDNGAEAPYAEPLAISKEGTTTIQYYSVDGSSNTEEKKTAEVKVDKSLPEITVNLESQESWQNLAIEITPTITDQISGIAQANLAWTNGDVAPESWNAYTSGALKQEATGEWYLHLKAVDVAGNEAITRFGPYKVDGVKPTTTVSLIVRDWESADVAVTPEYNDEGGSGLNAAQYAWSLEQSEPTQWQDFAGKDLVQSTEGSWYLFLRVADAAGNEVVNKYGPYNIDKTQPVINVEPISQDWVNTNITVLPNISDQVSGITVMEYAWTATEEQPEQWLPYTSGSVGIGDTGTWYLHLKTTDKAGNTATALFGTYNIDKVAPTTTLSLECRDWESTGVAITPSYQDEGGSSIKESQYAWTKEEAIPTQWDPYASGDLVQEEDGIWYLYLRVTDNAGNEAISKYGSFKIDKTAPEITADPTEKDWTNSDISVMPSVNDMLSGVASVEYSCSGSDALPGEWSIYSGGALAVQDTGIWYLHIKAIDNVGNVNTKCFGAYKIDKIAPIVAATPENREWLNEDMIITPTYNDEGGAQLAKRQYSWSTTPDMPGSWTDFAGTEITQGAEGEWYLFLNAVDNAGNEVSSQYGVYKVDKTLPEFNYSFNSEYFYGDTILLEFTATDSLSGIKETYVNFNGIRYENGTEVAIDKAGINTIEMVAIDAAGNVRTEVQEIEVIAIAEVNIDPNVINLKNLDKGDSKVTVYITLPAGLSVGDIMIETIRINSVAPITDPQYGYVINPVVNKDGQVVFMAKFERSALGAILVEGENSISLTGRTGSYRFIWNGAVVSQNSGNDNPNEEPVEEENTGKDKGKKN